MEHRAESAKNESTPLHFTARLADAVEYARHLHIERRKGTGIPYMAHLFGVASLVMGEAGLTEEAAPQLLVPGQVLGEPLQRDRPVELDVVREVDGRHRAVAQRPDELVAARDARHGAHRSFPSPPCPW